MERKNWVKPMTLVQKFEANETVANNCFLIACQSNVGNPNNPPAPEFGWEKKEGRYTSYGIGGETYWQTPSEFGHGNCYIASNNIFNIDGGNISFVRENGGASGDFYGVDSWTDVDGDKKVSEGDIVYWYNTSIGSFWRAGDRWNHWGEVKAVNPDKPCQS